MPPSSEPRFVRGADGLALVALLLLALVLGLGLSTETDAFFRVRVGEEILRRHALLPTNTFSFTFPDFPDLDTAWLAEVGMAFAHRLGGLAAVVVGKALLVAALAVVLFLAARVGASTGASLLATTLALSLMRDRFVERPHMVSLLGDACWLLLLLRWQRREADVRVSRRPWTLVPVVLGLVVWANAHAGIFLAPLLAAVLALGAWRLAQVAGPDRLAESAAARRFAWRASVAAGLAVLACLAQPHGLGIIRYWWLHLTLPKLHTVDEFRLATWRSDAPALSAFALGLVAGLLLARQRRQWWPWLPAAVVVSLLAGSSVRFSADALVGWVPLVAAAFDALGAWGAQRRPAWAPLFARALAQGGPAVLVGLVATTLFARAKDHEPLLAPRLAPPVPPEALAYVEAHGLRERMYNDFETGSYLLYEGYPRHRVFVDPRLPAYPASFHALLGRFDHDRASWDRAMTELGVESALLVEAGLNRRVAWWDPATWALVYRGHDARVFVRRLPAWRALIARDEVPLTYSFTVEEGASPHLLLEQPAGSPVAACEWQRRLGDLAVELDEGKLDHAWPFYRQALATPGCLAVTDEAPLVSWLGAELLLDRRPDEALPWLERAHALSPRDARVAANRAFALAGVGQRAAARLAWQEVAALAKDTPLEAKAKAQADALVDVPPQRP